MVRRKSGFTLVELLVVISIIALLLSILMPSLSKARQLARQTVCTGQVHQLGLFLATYAHSYNGKLPPSVRSDNWPFVGGFCPSDKNPGNYRNWEPAGIGALWKARLIDDPKKFMYCPAAKGQLTQGYLTFDNVLKPSMPWFPNDPITWGRFYTGYMYWVGWAPMAGWPIPEAARRNLERGVAKSMMSPSHTVTISCPIVTTIPSSGNPKDAQATDVDAFASHVSGGKVTGGSVLTVDGGARFEKMKKMLDNYETRLRLIDNGVSDPRNKKMYWF